MAGRTMRKTQGKGQALHASDTPSAQRVDGDVRGYRDRGDGHRSGEVIEVLSLPPVTALEIHTLGGFSISQRRATGEVVAIPPSAWRHGRTLALAHYLVSRPGFESPRDTIRDQLWPNVDPRTANTYLSNALWNLRKGIGTTRDAHAFVLVTPTAVKLQVAPLPQHAEGASLSTSSGVWMDFLAFQLAAKQAKNAQGAAQTLPMAQRALTLYPGDFLPECAEIRWSFSLRERLRQEWASMLMIAARACIELAQSEEALRLLDQLVCRMPDHEEGAAEALKLLISQRRYREAHTMYELVRGFYKETYRLEPPMSLQQLIIPTLARRRASAPLGRRIS